MLPDQRWAGPVRALVGRIRVGLTLLIAVLCLAATARAAESVDPSLAAEACAGCHGETRDQPAPIPDLASLSAAQIVEAMAAYQRGERNNPVMSLIARAYSVAEVAALAGALGGDTGSEADND